ncbi:MAG: chemotaxis protein CheW [Nannocystaceae bacterium]|nr:chemotaxis protein CheW [bacterium]
MPERDPGERTEDIWDQFSPTGEALATEEDYEHGYARVVRVDLQQHVVFRVGDETYGIPIAQIGEISKPMYTTPVPRTSDFVMGIGNVRGVVIPIVDLATRLRLGTCAMAREARVLIVRHASEQTGLLVDEVIGVMSIAPENLEEAPGALAGARGDFIRALARWDGRIIIILDLGTVLAPGDFLAPGVGRSVGRSGRG